MKLFNFERPTIVRVDIFVKGECKTFSVDETDSEKVRDELKNMLPKQVNISLNPTEPLSKVAVQCYEHTGKEKGKNKRFTVYGLTVQEVYDIFMKKLKS